LLAAAAGFFVDLPADLARAEPELADPGEALPLLAGLRERLPELAARPRVPEREPLEERDDPDERERDLLSFDDPLEGESPLDETRFAEPLRLVEAILSHSFLCPREVTALRALAYYPDRRPFLTAGRMYECQRVTAVNITPRPGMIPAWPR
jgi:hypothetical protein